MAHRGGVPPKDTRFQPGVSGNPSGKNQYTYKREFEGAIETLLSGELGPELTEFIPEKMRKVIEAKSQTMTTGEAIALGTVIGALSGNEKHLETVLKRLWPVTEKHEHSGLDGGPIPTQHRVDMTVYTAEEREMFKAMAHRQLERPKKELDS